MSVITFISLVASVLLVVSGKPLSSQPDAALATKGDESIFRKILEGTAADATSDLKNSSALHMDPKDIEQVEENLRNTRDELLETLAKNADIQFDERTNEPIRLISERVLQQTLEQIFENHQRKVSAENNDKVLSTIASIEQETTPGNETDSDASGGSNSNSISSRIICQFFVFGTLFGVVCSISTCTCFLQPRARNNRTANGNTDVNPSNVPAPIDYNKPYQLKCDSKGQCYASPLNDDEIPPLPSYDIALTMPSTPLSEKDKKPSKESLSPTTSSTSTTHY
ncbi:hypothetical protein QR680_006057 [Steinernema hermaphroditum]|uniref:Uncharacterized protein n=1 Tax=Steinernema hermaphroditum TaxID=289476 RepID=A0AA39LWR4_9BILA|nr:hypothetical protein QR680_006057 [Steinernema hermaphroditum]